MPDPERQRIAREWYAAFDTHFWPAYPRRIDKQDARKAWGKLLLPRGSLEEHEELLGSVMGGVEWYRDSEWKNRPDDKIPHAATWLNKRRWEDAFDGCEDANAATPQHGRG